MAGIKFTIDAENRSAAAIGQSIQQIQRLESELRKLRASGDQTAQGQTRLGQAALNVAQAKQQLAQTTKTLTEGNGALSSAVRAATASLERQAGPLGGLVTSLGSMNLVAGLASATVAAFGVASLTAAKAVGDYQERLSLAAASTGLATRDIAGLSLAAAETGRSFEQLRPALDFFSRKIGEAASNNKEAIAAFAALGVAIRTSSGGLRETGDIFRDVQAALAGMASGPERAKVAFELFGRGASASLGALLSPLDQAIARAEKFGLVFSGEAQRTAEEADSALDRMGAAFQGFGLRVALALAPIGTAIANSITSALVGMQTELSESAAATARATASLDSYRAMAEQAAGAQKKLNDELARKALENREGGAVGQSIVSALGITQSRQTTGATVGGVFGVPPSSAPLAGPVEKFKESVDKFAASLPGGTGIFGAEWGRSPVRSELEAFRPFESRFGPGFVPPQFTPTQVPDIPGIKFNEDMFQDTKESIRALGGQLESTFAGFISDAILGVNSLADAMKNLLLSVADILIQAGVKAILPFQSGGTVAALQSGGTVVPSSSWPLRAQSGLVVSGIRGVDSVPALLGRGETVIDHTTTDNLKSFLSQVLASRPAQTPGRAPLILNLTFNGVASGQGELREFVRDVLMPEVRTAIARGAA